jgi:cellulose synthase/poly-beta-1,6-N-acetylglucosamine synthase-like glycosyltransferase
MMLLLFFLTFILLTYTYFGYPVLLRLGDALLPAREPSTPSAAGSRANAEPVSASLVIPAYNEEADIRSKLENVLRLDHAKGKLEIIVASDASSDRTDDIVREFAGKGVSLFRLEKRGGKIAAYKNAVRRASGEIFIFTDATSQLEPDSLDHMLRHFADPSVGCVAGRLIFVSQEDGGIGKGEEAYWDYNIWIKAAESRLASLTSVSGTFFAVRKELFPIDMPSDLAEDFIVPLVVVRRGFRTILESKAVCREVSVHAESQEIRKRARITVQNIRGLIYGRDLLNVFRYGLFSVLLISHKLLRTLAPLMLAALFVLNVALLRSSAVFMPPLAAQTLFYAVGFLSGLRSGRRTGVVNAVHFFCLSNCAIFLGILMWLRGDMMATWETERA